MRTAGAFNYIRERLVYCDEGRSEMWVDSLQQPFRYSAPAISFRILRATIPILYTAHKDENKPETAAPNPSEYLVRD